MTDSNYTEMRSYAYELVRNRKTCYAHLDEDEKFTLTGLIINSYSKIDAWEFISEADKNCELPYVLADLMKLGTTCSEKAINKVDNLVTFMMEKASEYAAKRIDDFLLSIEEQYKFDMKHYVPED